MYGSVDQVKALSGISTDDLGDVEEDDALGQMLTTWLTQISDTIDHDLERSEPFGEGEVPPGVDLIATRLCTTLALYAVQMRTSKLVKIDEMSVRIGDVELFTRDISKSLRRYRAKPRITMAVIGRRRRSEEDDEGP